MPVSSAEAPAGRPGRFRRQHQAGTGATSRAEEGLRDSLESARLGRAVAEEHAFTAAEGIESVAIDQRLLAEAREGISAPTTSVGGFRRSRRARIAFWLAVGWMGLVIFAAIFANVLPLPNPNKVLVGPIDQGPSWHFWFGTDQIGHDIFSQVVYGARISMIIGSTSVVVGILIGGSLGVIAGFYRGIVDVLVVWVTDVLLTLPGLVLALTLVAFLGQSLFNVVLAIDLLSIPAYARIARATSFAVSQREFVLAQMAIGSRPRRILVRDVMPLVALPIASYAAIGASVAILAEGALAFLGLSAPNSLSWGGLIAAGQQELSICPQLVFAPMIIFFLTIVALNFIGQRAGERLDPRQSSI